MPPPSQQELDSMVSMIMVNLPFPPLPVMAVNGHGDDSFCSSHDLLSRAIACNLLSRVDKTVSHEESDKEKLNVLLSLNHSNAQKYENCNMQRTVDDIYNMYCSHFRQFMAQFRGSPDLRIMPLQSVDCKSIIFQQAVQHLTAKRINLNEDTTNTNNHSSYADLLREYAMDLYSERKIL